MKNLEHQHAELLTNCLLEDENGNWETGCGETFCFDDGGVRPNKHYFCPNCGKPIDEVKYEWEEA